MGRTTELLRASWRSWLTRDPAVAGPRWWQYGWTVAFCAAAAAGLTLLGFAFRAGDAQRWSSPTGWWAWYQANLIITLTIGLAIHLLYDLTLKAIGPVRLRRWSRAGRNAYYLAVPVAGVMVGWPIGMRLALGVDLREWFTFEQPVLGGLTLSFVASVLFWLFFDGKERQIRAEKRAAEAQLKLLQGQIEPHFLFNTLANVIGLMEHDTPRAKRMLEAFADYLRASFATLRGERHTLGDELALVEAYLRVVGTRMDDRLQWHIDVPDTLRGIHLLPLTLQPLVENAVVHGLEPKLEGGTLSVRARRDADGLVIVVEDDGLGLRPPALRRPNGSGSAIVNIRARLLAAFGSAAGLHVDAATPAGVCARLRLPASEPA